MIGILMGQVPLSQTTDPPLVGNSRAELMSIILGLALLKYKKMRLTDLRNSVSKPARWSNSPILVEILHDL
jgi:hypothetical protein